MAVFEIDASAPERAAVAQRLMAGHIVLLRNCDAIRRFRVALNDYARANDPAGCPDLDAFYSEGRPPSVPTTLAVSRALKKARADRFLSRCLAPLIGEMGFGPPVRLDGGIPRIVMPPEIVEAARKSGLFASEDFTRSRAGGATEVFMPAPANIHRDYNRQHFLFQCNVWFPLHDADEDNVLRIYPECYRQPIYDMDPTDDNLRTLGEPLRYRLAFGDAIMFHGEHLHTSPAVGPSFRRRHSYDFRIASLCFDDTKHYRDGFLDLRNFPTRSAPAPRLDMQPATEHDDCALPALLEVEQSPSLGEGGLVRLADLFDRFTFAEDRYLILAERAAPVSRGVAGRALASIVERSPLWFWVALAGQGYLALGDRARAVTAFRKARDLAGAQVQMPNFMPITYENPPKQPMPQAIRQFCEQALAQSR